MGAIIHIAICDDNAAFLTRLSSRVEGYAQKAGLAAEVHRFDKGEALAAAPTGYDIVLLDIDMPGMDGLAVARAIRGQNKDAYIVFITSYMEYALQGYEVRAFRYILKSQLDEVLPYCLDEILTGLLAKRRSYRFKFVEGEEALRAEDILYVESQRHKLLFHLAAGGQRSLYAKLDELEAHLGDVRFLRIHKSFLVNLNHVLRIKNYEAELANGTFLPVPKQKYADVKQRFVLLKGEL